MHTYTHTHIHIHTLTHTHTHTHTHIHTHTLTQIRLMVSFQFDERAVLATLPDMNTRSFTFSLIDALADQMKAVSTQELSIRAIADYFLNLQ